MPENSSYNTLTQAERTHTGEIRGEGASPDV